MRLRNGNQWLTLARLPSTEIYWIECSALIDGDAIPRFITLSR
jgi:hypothetical protein